MSQPEQQARNWQQAQHQRDESAVLTVTPRRDEDLTEDV